MLHIAYRKSRLLGTYPKSQLFYNASERQHPGIVAQHLPLTNPKYRLPFAVSVLLIYSKVKDRRPPVARSVRKAASDQNQVFSCVALLSLCRLDLVDGADDPGRDTAADHHGRHIIGHHRAGRHDGVVPDGHTRGHGDIGSDPDLLADYDGGRVVVAPAVTPSPRFNWASKSWSSIITSSSLASPYIRRRCVQVCS